MRRDLRRAAYAGFAALLIASLLISFSGLLVSPLASMRSAATFLSPGVSANPVLKSESHSSKYWYVGAVAPTLEANQGVRTMIEVREQRVSAFLAFWVSDTMSNNLWAQVGYYIFRGATSPQAFYQVWNLSTRTEIASGARLVSLGVHLFSMYVSSGSVWSFALDGSTQIGRFDMKTSYSSQGAGVYALSEEGYCSLPFPFQAVQFEGPLQVFLENSASWTSLGTATSYGSAWGMIYGTNYFAVGGNYTALPEGTTLWS